MRANIELHAHNDGRLWKWELIVPPVMWACRIEARNFYGSEEAARKAGVNVAKMLGLEGEHDLHPV